MSFLTSLKIKFPVSNDILFYLTAEQADRVTKLSHSLSAHVRSGPIQRQSTVQRQICLLIRVQNITFNILLLLCDCDGTMSKDIVMLNQKRIVVSYCVKRYYVAKAEEDCVVKFWHRNVAS